MNRNSAAFFPEVSARILSLYKLLRPRENQVIPVKARRFKNYQDMGSGHADRKLRERNPFALGGS
jgi:hypothetical protein